jgi:hypothetical protein
MIKLEKFITFSAHLIYIICTVDVGGTCGTNGGEEERV